MGAGWKLLSVLLQGHLVSNHTDVWSLFKLQVPTYSQEALRLLAVALLHLELPENVGPVSLPGLGSQEYEKRPHQLRCQLLQWLLPSSYQDQDQPTAKRDLPWPNPDLLADVLVTLTLRNTQNISIPTDQQPASELQDLYQQSTFDVTLHQWRGKTEDLESEVNNSSCLRFAF